MMFSAGSMQQGCASRCCWVLLGRRLQHKGSLPGALLRCSRWCTSASYERRQTSAPQAAPRAASSRTAVSRATPQAGRQFYATCHPGLEQVVAAELQGASIGATDVQPGKAGVSFRGQDLATGYRANLWLRAAIRVLVQLAEGDLDAAQPGGDELYRFVRAAAPWPRMLAPQQSFSVEARVASCTDVPSSLLVQIRARDAICDAIRDARGSKPMPPGPGQVADLPLYAALFRDHVTLYADMSGDSLHRRGYRAAMHRASLNEAAAAGMLALANWPQAAADPGTVFADPMCGSGTFLIEAALVATNQAPGLFRERWPFQSWSNFSAPAWQQCVTEARQARRPWRGVLQGNDIHEGALSLARRDAQAAGVGDLVQLSCGPAARWRPARQPTFVICNPPWGQRLLAAQADSSQTRGEEQSWQGRQPQPAAAAPPPALAAAWQELGTFLKAECSEAFAHVLSGNRDMSRELRLKASRKHAVVVGGVDVRLLSYHVRSKGWADQPLQQPPAAPPPPPPSRQPASAGRRKPSAHVRRFFPDAAEP